MGQLDGLSFAEVLCKYPERRLKLPPFKLMMNTLRRVKPLSRAHANNYVIAASEQPFAFPEGDVELLAVPISQPLRAYMVGTLYLSKLAETPIIANVTIPSGARVNSASVRAHHFPQTVLPAFTAHTVEVDSCVELNMRVRSLHQVGGFIPKDNDDYRKLYLGMQTAAITKPFIFFVDQGNALRYAGVKR